MITFLRNSTGLPEFEGARFSPTVSDGYWIMLKPLFPGKHTIYIYGKAVFSDGLTSQWK